MTSGYVPHPTTAPADEKLILKTVDLAMMLAGEKGGYDADPCGNSAHQWQLSKKPEGGRASDLLAQITKMPVKTYDGLTAKTLLIPYFMQYEPDEFDLDDRTCMDFIRSIPEDLKRLRREPKATAIEVIVGFARQVVKAVDARQGRPDTLSAIYNPVTGKIGYGPLDQPGINKSLEEGRLLLVTDEVATALRTLAKVLA